VDASALLWRLDLSDVNVGDRRNELSLAWDAQADGQLYAFNDWDAAMAHRGAGRRDRVERLLTAARRAGDSEAARWRRETSLPLIEGFAAFRRDDYATVVERLLGARTISNGVGGSHAQRDVTDWTLTEAAIRGGLTQVADGLAQERLALRPHSPVNGPLPGTRAGGLTAPRSGDGRVRRRAAGGRRSVAVSGRHRRRPSGRSSNQAAQGGHGRPAGQEREPRRGRQKSPPLKSACPRPPRQSSGSRRAARRRARSDDGLLPRDRPAHDSLRERAPPAVRMGASRRLNTAAARARAIQ